jgi:hypothetical protein
MTSTKKIIEEIRRLSDRDRRIVIRHLEQLRAKPSTGTGRAAPRPRARVRPYASLLEIAGRAHSNEVDVSTDKYRHLAAAYADNHDAE